MFGLIAKTTAQKTDEVMLGLVILFGIIIVVGVIIKNVRETVKCPYCLEGISRSAKVCKHCGRDV
jgi:hypothetical protein